MLVNGNTIIILRVLHIHGHIRNRRKGEFPAIDKLFLIFEALSIIWKIVYFIVLIILRVVIGLISVQLYLI